MDPVLTHKDSHNTCAAQVKAHIFLTLSHHNYSQQYMSSSVPLRRLCFFLLSMGWLGASSSSLLPGRIQHPRLPTDITHLLSKHCP